jgi:hypothetical protein
LLHVSLELEGADLVIFVGIGFAFQTQQVIIGEQGLGFLGIPVGQLSPLGEVTIVAPPPPRSTPE